MDSKSGGCSGQCENSEKVGHSLTPSTKNEQCSGCGLDNSEKITLTVAPTTGGRFEISLSQSSTIDNLKKVISKKLRVPKERILLLNKDKQLRAGNLKEHSLCDGSTVTLLPSVETGLLTQRPEQGVMQALESLNDSQVNDFLSGKSPLNLTMRLGDHMMLIQLQLSTITPSSSKKSTTIATAATTSATSSTTATTSTSTSTSTTINLPKNIVISTTEETVTATTATTTASASSPSTSTSSPSTSDARTVSSLSLVEGLKECSDFYSKINNIIQKNFKLKRKLVGGSSASETETVTPPKRPRIEDNIKFMSKLNELLSTNDSNNNSGNNRDRISTTSSIATSTTNASVSAPPDPSSAVPTCQSKCKQTLAEGNAHSSSSCCENKCTESATLDTKALAEASRNLTQTLKQLSSEVLTCRRSETVEDGVVKQTVTPRRRVKATPGAIIESMKHHGKGVFSGTFSGTLNPALQDRFGRPKRDISTIIHILNDLLCATPQYRRNQAPTKQDPQDNGSELDGASAGNGLSAVEENEATRGKLEKLRMVMEQNRARRKARREGRMPCSTVWNSEQTADMTAVDEEMDDSAKQEQNELHELTCAEPVTA